MLPKSAIHKLSNLIVLCAVFLSACARPVEQAFSIREVVEVVEVREFPQSVSTLIKLSVSGLVKYCGKLPAWDRLEQPPGTGLDVFDVTPTGETRRIYAVREVGDECTLLFNPSQARTEYTRGYFFAGIGRELVSREEMQTTLITKFLEENCGNGGKPNAKCGFAEQGGSPEIGLIIPHGVLASRFAVAGEQKLPAWIVFAEGSYFRILEERS